VAEVRADVVLDSRLARDPERAVGGLPVVSGRQVLHPRTSLQGVTVPGVHAQ